MACIILCWQELTVQTEKKGKAINCAKQYRFILIWHTTEILKQANFVPTLWGFYFNLPIFFSKYFPFLRQISIQLQYYIVSFTDIKPKEIFLLTSTSMSGSFWGMAPQSNDFYIFYHKSLDCLLMCYADEHDLEVLLLLPFPICRI